MDRNPEIHKLLEQFNDNEDLAADSRRHMDDFRGFCLARSNSPHVEIRKAVLVTKLKELLGGARRDGKL